MGLIEKQVIKQNISPPLDGLLAEQLVDEFVSMERRFIQRDWEPAELDGGQFCEVLARVIYHVDSANLNHSKSLDDCLRYVDNETVTHNFPLRSDSLHIARVIRAVYKFRSQRGAVHISPTYKANHMDSKFMIESVRWCMNEILRIFWQGPKEQGATAIREVLQFDVPCIGTFEGAILVQRTDLNPEQEVLVLLHYAGERGFSRTEVGRYAKCSASSVTRSLQNLCSPELRQALQISNGNYRLTDLGSKRMREELSTKLLLQ